MLLQISTAGQSIGDTIQQAVTQIQSPPQPVSTVESLTLIELVMKGGIVMIPLFILSLLAVYFFFERLIAIRKAGRINHNFMHNIRDFIFDYKLDAAKALCKSVNSPISRMVEKGLGRVGKPIDEIERSLESVGRYEITKLEKNLKILGIVAGIAPMLGFIGTIMGVIKIFYNISLADNISIGIIAGGLYEKMITSATGLIIGVLAYTGYHYLNILLDKVVFQLEDSSREFLDLLQKEA
ncbi:MAG TPA: MotA/TolQ/ExbB proton channel family protein [Bacteroidales bacterium]|nr:MotA/TolQ/ExbB proton channel family protein [Bacteroidales bacterium]HSA43179.1 MotA/TolQ/ExbB proton channel family protein [Bacteroidales bacterium]